MDRFYVGITEDEIRTEALVAKTSENGCGASILFLGTVRNEHHGKRVEAITYDVHPALAEKALDAIASEVLQDLPGGGVAVLHRVGYVKAGEICIGISVSSPHRKEAYVASRRIIEEIKRRVPIWKKEHYDNGSSAWLAGTVLKRDAPSR